jgi:conjugal transfer pilus assembly protein TraK
MTTPFAGSSTAESKFRKTGTSMSKSMQSKNPRHFNFNLSTRQTVLAVLSIFTLVNGVQVQAEPSKVETPGVPAQVLAEAKRETPEIPTTAQTIQVSPGVNEIIPVAVGHLNRIVTPFDKPHVRTVSQATTQIEGNVLYVATPDETPVALYITPGETEDFALLLTLAPRKIPPREVRLTLDAVYYQKLTSLQNAAGLNGQDGKPGNPSQSSQDYVADIKAVFRALALMRTPKGYALRNPTGSETIHCSQSGLFTHTGQVLEGRNRVLLVSVARNTGTSPLEIDERSCADAGGDVLAVSAWPKVMLEPGEATELYVALRQTKDNDTTARPSLLDGGR